MAGGDCLVPLREAAVALAGGAVRGGTEPLVLALRHRSHPRLLAACSHGACPAALHSCSACPLDHASLGNGWVPRPICWFTC